MLGDQDEMPEMDCELEMTVSSSSPGRRCSSVVECADEDDEVESPMHGDHAHDGMEGENGGDGEGYLGGGGAAALHEIELDLEGLEGEEAMGGDASAGGHTFGSISNAWDEGGGGSSGAAAADGGGGHSGAQGADIDYDVEVI
jgi:hypothetical protein